MLISRAPFRVSFFGGSSDYLQYLENHDGVVVGSSIAHYLYICSRWMPGYFNFKTLLQYSQVERVDNNNDIDHKPFREVIKHLGLENSGLELSVMSDLPSRMGVGSSSSFLVSLTLALNALKDDDRSKHELYEEVVNIEQNVLKENVGLQDTAMAVFGGLNEIRFSRNQMVVKPLGLKRDEKKHLESHLMIFFTGIQRSATEVAGSYINDMTEERIRRINNIKEIAEDGIKAIKAVNIEWISQLLWEAWKEKRSISKNISSQHIDEIFSTALLNGATSGKILGAGGGGCILLLCDPMYQHSVRNALSGLVEIPFRFESEGAKVIFRGNTVHAEVRANS